MAIWKEIRKTINSTLGTKSFKPLDKIIRDSYYVYASDDLLKTLYQEANRTDGTADISLQSVGKINLSGAIKLKCEIMGSGWRNTYVFLGVKGKLKQFTLPSSHISSEPYVIETEVEVQKGDEFQIQADIPPGALYTIDSIKLTANGKVGSAPDTGIFAE